MRLLLLFLFALQSPVPLTQPENVKSQLDRVAEAMRNGDNHLDSGDVNQALASYFMAHKESGGALSIDFASVLNKIGNAYNEVRMSEEAIIYLDSALMLRSKLLGAKHLEVSHVHNNLGIAYLNLGDFDRAEDYHREALTIRNATGPPDFRAQSLNNLGLCLLQHQKFTDALESFEGAAKIYRDIGAKEKLADTFLNRGNVYSDWYTSFGDSLSPGGQAPLAAAQQSYLRAYSQYQSLPDSDRWQALCLNNLGNNARQHQDFDSAERYYQQALRLRKQHLTAGHPEITETYFNLGMNTYQLGSLSGSIPYFDSCIALTGFDEKEQNFDRIIEREILLYALFRKATIYVEKYAVSNDPADLFLSLSHFEKVDKLLEYIFMRYESVDAKLGLAAISHAIYEEALDVTSVLFNLTQEEKYAHQAFYFSEKSKGLILLEALKKNNVENFHGVPKAMIDNLSQLEQEASEFERALLLSLDHGSVLHVDSLESNLFRQKQLVRAQIEKIGQHSPHFYNLRYRVDPPTIPQLQRNLLQPDQSQLSYFLGASNLWIFLVSADDFEMRQIPVSGQILEVLATFLATIERFTTSSSTHLDQLNSDYVASARYLHDLLVLPVSEFLKERLIIVPDGLLNFLPFDALLTKPVSEANPFRNHPYLIKEHSVSYNFSVRLWEEMSSNKNPTRPGSYLGFAPSFDGIGLPPLLHNRAEVELANETMRGRVFLEGAATKSAFVEHLDQHTIIHLATHGMAHGAEEELSYLAFTQLDEEVIDNSRLYVNEIYGLDAPAEIVVLSACQTGTGRLYQGEGIASIARSFSFAGAKSLLSTRWNVNDATTKLLVAGFFEKINLGIPKDLALQQSIRDFIQSSNHFHAHPFFWSAFMAIGNMEPLVSSPSSWFKKWPWAVLLLLLILFSKKILKN